MASCVEGPLMAIEEGVTVVEAGYVGLIIHVPISLPPELPGIGKEVMAYTYFRVREGAAMLYGFLYSQNRGMLRQLLGVNGIGPKGAPRILSTLCPDDLRLTIVSEDVKALAKMSGIGNKTAQRLILDLKDKTPMDDILGNIAGGAGMGAVDIGVSVAGLAEAAKEAVQALVALGYISTEASRAMKRAEITGGMTLENVLRASLGYLSFLQGFW